MFPDPPIAALRARYNRGASPQDELARVLPRSNANASHNTYLVQDVAWTEAQAAALPPGVHHQLPLSGIPVSLKDCFDLAGFPTSCGSKFYRQANGIASEDSALAARLRSRGAVITGKTHLHPLAYGITGENPEFGDCLQPADAALLTGGSSSGAAASIQEGSALVAIGTDTGGSVRTPAALCGLAGFRASITVGKDLWRGGAHLAPSFDTLGVLFSDLRDGPFLGQAIFDIDPAPYPRLDQTRIGIPNDEFFYDCDADVRRTLETWRDFLDRKGVHIVRFDTAFWSDAFDIFAPIQASEAAAIHAGNFDHFPTAIADRLRWGAGLKRAELLDLHERKRAFEQQMDALFADNLLAAVLLPASPVSALYADEDQSQTRTRILRYTTPVSLSGLPALTLPPVLEGAVTGLQLAGPVNSDAALLALGAIVEEEATR